MKFKVIFGAFRYEGRYYKAGEEIELPANIGNKYIEVLQPLETTKQDNLNKQKNKGVEDVSISNL